MRWILQRCCVLALVALAGCASPASPASLRTRTDHMQVLVVRRGWHVDLGLAAEDLQGPLAFLRKQFPASHYVFIGFGDERYVRSSTHRLPALLAAAWPGRGVMLVTAIENTPAEAFGAKNVRFVPVARPGATAFEEYVADSFARSGDSAPMQAGPYSGSLYFGSSRRYSGLHTCNTWAAEALRAAGLPVHTTGVILANQLWHQVRPLAVAGEP